MEECVERMMEMKFVWLGNMVMEEENESIVVMWFLLGTVSEKLEYWKEVVMVVV